MKNNHPKKQGLYEPKYERDSCGIGFVANIYDKPSRDIINYGLNILCNLTHRGAVSADPLAGDGVGILTQIPHDFFQQELIKDDVILPKPDEYAVGMFFLPKDEKENSYCIKIIKKFILKFGLEILYQREVPVDNSILGKSIIGKEPSIAQFFLRQIKPSKTINHFESILFLVRRYIELALEPYQFYCVSLSPRTIIYKGMVMSDRLKCFYLDLNDEKFISSLAIVHQRFSTNTFPSWELAQPFRFLCHNGEINTLRGNLNWMNARARISTSELFSDDFKNINPLILEGVSDSAAFDNALEYLIIGGYDIEKAMMLLIPEAWEKNTSHSTKLTAFYDYHANYIEPWDGPAAMCFTDGRKIGGVLDRNGLRPSRYCETEDGLVLLSSEMGVLELPPEKIKKRWRLEPGKMFFIDLDQKKIIQNDELKKKYSIEHNYESHLKKNQLFLADFNNKKIKNSTGYKREDLKKFQYAFGYTKEDINFFIDPIIQTGIEPTGSMGTDTPVSVLSKKHKLLYSYNREYIFI